MGERAVDMLRRKLALVTTDQPPVADAAADDDGVVGQANDADPEAAPALPGIESTSRNEPSE